MRAITVFVLLAVCASNALAEDDRFKLRVLVNSAAYYTDNGDFRPLDESNDRAVIDSDDRRIFGHSDLTARMTYVVEPDVKLNTDLRFDIVWRDDQLGRTAGSSGNLGVYRLNVEYDAYRSEALSFKLVFGRQAFSIGGVPNDYILAGTLDALSAVADFGKAGRLRILGVDFFGGNALPENGYLFYRDGRQSTYNLRGETNTLRTGFVYEYDRSKAKSMPIDLRAYYFYAAIGGGPIEESGADITFGGALGNYRDADYQQIAGGRFGYTGAFGKTNLRLFGEFSRSMGIDRKNPNERDVVTDGNAYGGGLVLTTQMTDAVELGFLADFYHFDGSSYASDGLEFERGYVGFKGMRIGGQTVGRFLGWRPSSHVDAAGVVYAPHDQSRISGTQFIHAGVSLTVNKLKLMVDSWLMKDTSKTFLDLPRLDSLPRPPFGRTKAEFAAQERLGKDLGMSVDVGLEYAATKTLTLVSGLGLFLPGDYYAIEVDRVAGNQRASLGGDATFVAGWMGVRLAFQ